MLFKLLRLRREIDKIGKKFKEIWFSMISRTGAVAMTREIKYLINLEKTMKMFYEKDTDVNLIKDKKL